MISSLYAAIARRRREWYSGRPDLRRRLRRPVISIGNIAAGGRGKTPFTAGVARLLMEMGERPAILSRGYGRVRPEDGVVVVRDAQSVRADLDRSGDEPLMLARQLPGAIVVTSTDRFLAGRLAEHHLGATVHILDDGFQHFQLDRDIDIVLVTQGDVERATTFPGGRLREPADVLVAADAIVAIGDATLPEGDAPVFRVRRQNAAAVFEGAASPASRKVLGLAGIAEPRGFLEMLQAAGWIVVNERVYPDHHAYSRHDVGKIVAAARAAGVEAILTTEKDYVRLLPHRPFPIHVGWVPLTMEPESRADFRQWLISSIASARDIVLV